MFVGHLAVSFGAKVVEPKAPLGALVAVSFGLDLLWSLLLLTGLEVVQVAPGDTAFTPLAFESYPWSHSLLMALVWGVSGGGVTYVAIRTQRAAATVGMVVASEPVSGHRVPLASGSERSGHDAWNLGTSNFSRRLAATTTSCTTTRRLPAPRVSARSLFKEACD